ELVALRAVGTGPTAMVAPAANGSGGSPQFISATISRLGRSGSDAHARIEIGIFEDDAVAMNQAVEGPALIERWDTSIWVPVGYIARRDCAGNLLLEATCAR